MKKPSVFKALALLMLCAMLFSCLTIATAESAEETYKLKLNIEFEGNMFFSKYNVRLNLDGKQIALMKHGEDYTGTQTVTAGNHTITFTKEDDSKITSRAELFVEGDTTFSCLITVYREGIDVMDVEVVSIPSGKKNARTTPLDTYFFGSYEQDNKPENGKEDIEWYIADQKDGKALLISKKTLDNQPFNRNAVDTTWETSSIREWLNSTFLSTAFTAKEQDAILTSTVENTQAGNSEEWQKLEAPDTQDKVFLLSYNEYMKYLVLSDEKDSPATEYANKKGSNWNIWLRSPGRNRIEMQYFSISSYDSEIVTSSNGVRPAIWVEMETADYNSSFEDYYDALALEMQGYYAEAATLFESLNGYDDSEIQAKECRYQQAIQLYDDGSYEDAISVLEKIVDYKDSAHLILINKYSKALEYEEKGEYESALQILMSIGQYEESTDHVLSCFDRLHIQYSWLSRNIGSAVNAGHDTGYAKKDPITDGDPHFGWSLGRFMMSGYTEIQENGNRPVFIKTPGDSVTLWFDLTQDIDNLNDDKNLRINRDTNGKDQEFQYPQSDFGRGALLIKHVDFRGSDSDVQIYTDFLSAKNGTGANTTVELNEEGIYEVALDYEIEKKGVVSGYNDYRIYTTFEIKNGSNMFFMFDLETGRELQDYSRTDAGFRIDLANSHSLSVAYTRYAINQDETGLDIRKKEPAADGDEFNKVGYYEITVTNTQTKEQLTKHIFVGRIADLEEFQAVDDSLSRFSK